MNWRHLRLIGTGIVYLLTISTSDLATAVDLLDPQVTESSGLGFSQRHENRIWTHNDSGDNARLFAFDSESGQRTGGCTLQGVEAIDWEAMATFVDAKGTAQILIADCGDNLSKRNHFLLHLFAEPDPNQDTVLSPNDRVTMRVRHPGGPTDCEAVAVDASSGQVILISKGRFPIARVETLSLSAFDRPQQIVTTELVATLPLPMITGLDIDPTSGDLLLASYFGLVRYSKPDPKADLFAQLRGTPRTLAAPPVKQLEAVAFDREGTPWVTSEGKPVLVRVSDD